MILSRRSLVTGAAAILSAPAIVRASSLMPVQSVLRYTPPRLPYEIDHALADRGESIIRWAGETDIMVSLSGSGFAAVIEYGRRERVRQGLPPDPEPDPNRPRLRDFLSREGRRIAARTIS